MFAVASTHSGESNQTSRSIGLNVIVSVDDEMGTGEASPTALPNDGTGRAWQVLAPAFRGDNGILFEIMNEPLVLDQQGVLMKRTIGNLSLNVEEMGAGEISLVFLHYWGGTHRTWNKVIAQLENSFHSVAYDMRGWGQSDAAESGYSIAELAKDAASLIQQLELKKYVLIGHSMGGKVAQLLASHHPAGLIGLILVAPAAPIPIRFPEEALQQQIHAYDNRETVLQAIAFLSARTPGPDVVEQIVEDSLSGVPEAKLAWPTSAILEDISSEVSRIAVPTLVLAGEQDRLDSIEQHRREIIARIPNSRLEIIAGSGHLIPIDEPVKLAGAIAEFATQLPAFRHALQS